MESSSRLSHLTQFHRTMGPRGAREEAMSHPGAAMSPMSGPVFLTARGLLQTPTGTSIPMTQL
jgi:hypothetical protein